MKTQKWLGINNQFLNYSGARIFVTPSGMVPKNDMTRKMRNRKKELFRIRYARLNNKAKFAG